MTDKRIEFHKKHYEVCFDEGIPDRKEERRRKLIYPEELLDKKCGGCVRCIERDHMYQGKKEGYHCTKLPYEREITPDDKACVDYWDKAEEDRLETLHQQDVENRRKELWDIYGKKEPVKLPIVRDDFGGRIPICPICGEMPYSTEQCHFCGQRFIQDKEIEEYNTPDTGTMDCFKCGGKGTVRFIRSKYNGHKSGECTKCGMSFIE